jgi:L-asparaginase/Glu-tRNA(Gln) amidotransferase subunit D
MRREPKLFIVWGAKKKGEDLWVTTIKSSQSRTSDIFIKISIFDSGGTISSTKKGQSAETPCPKD